MSHLSVVKSDSEMGTYNPLIVCYEKCSADSIRLKVTRHEYMGRRQFTTDAGITFEKTYFRCCVCGNERVYG